MQPIADCGNSYPSNPGPVGHCFCLTVMCNPTSCLPVLNLLLHSCPPAIHCVSAFNALIAMTACVMSIAVNPVDRILAARSVSHVAIEVLEFLPPLANSDVIVAMRHASSTAYPTHNTDPRVVHLGSNHSVSLPGASNQLCRLTATSSRLSRFQTIVSNRLCFTAVANASPMPLSIWVATSDNKHSVTVATGNRLVLTTQAPAALGDSLNKTCTTSDNCFTAVAKTPPGGVAVPCSHPTFCYQHSKPNPGQILGMLLVPTAATGRTPADKISPKCDDNISAVASAVPATVSSSFSELVGPSCVRLNNQLSKSDASQILRVDGFWSRITLSHDMLLDAEGMLRLEPVGRTIRPLARVILA